MSIKHILSVPICAQTLLDDKLMLVCLVINLCSCLDSIYYSALEIAFLCIRCETKHTIHYLEETFHATVIVQPGRRN